jgi:hypothetical protein
VGFVERSDKDGHPIVARLKEELAPQKDQLRRFVGPRRGGQAYHCR